MTDVRSAPRRLLAAAAWLAVAAPALAADPPPGNVTAERLAHADAEPGNWLTLGRDAHQDYYSPLAQIDETSVGRLGFAWSADLGTHRAAEATPIVVDGVMYTAGYVGIVYAVDAATGREKWRFDPHVPDQAIRNPCCDALNRGVAVWQGRVYVASVEGRLHALDAATGRELWSVDTITDHKLSYSSTGAPIVAHGVVVIGNSGGDMDRGGVRGYVSAYDLASGALAWRFFTVPPAPGKPLEHAELEAAAKSWAPGRPAVFQGGATVWDGMTYDPDLNLLYFGTGNAAPYDIRQLGPGNGDMLYACSIIAVDPDTGRMAWYYQATPNDHWDFDAVQKLVLADLAIDGKPRQVVMQANKNGFFYVLDRKTGALLSAKNFSYVNWASSVDPKTGRPVLTPQAEYYRKPKNVYPSAAGAHTWQPMSFDPQTKLVYIPVVDMPNILLEMVGNGGRLHYINGNFNVTQVYPDDTYDPDALKSLFGPLPSLASLQAERKGVKLTRELLRAWDPVAGKTVWEHETGSGVRSYDGGLLSTAGNLVFQGHGNGELVVYAADTGKELKRIQTGSHIMAAPITYSVNGVQYVAVQAGYGGGGIAIAPYPPKSIANRYGNENRLIAFKLDGGPAPMPPELAAEPIPKPPESKATKADIERGEVKFWEQCSRCHVMGPNVTPDLRKLTPELHAAFEDIVLKGAFASEGMEKFDDLLSPADVQAIHAFLIDQQRQAYAEQQKVAH
jgi:quinohemoprotein ethanol dehydrogenase